MRDTTLKKQEAIKTEFNRLSHQKTERGKKKYTTDYIIEELQKKFFLSRSSIEKIIYKKS